MSEDVFMQDNTVVLLVSASHYKKVYRKDASAQLVSTIGDIS